MKKAFETPINPRFAAYFIHQQTGYGQGATFTRSHNMAHWERRVYAPQNPLPLSQPENNRERPLIQVLLRFDPGQCLAWEKPLAKQTVVVQRALAAAGITAQYLKSLAEAKGPDAEDAGYNIYGCVVRLHGADALKKFEAAGIPGIRFLDNGVSQHGDAGQERFPSDHYTVFNLEAVGKAIRRGTGKNTKYLRGDTATAALNEILSVAAAAFQSVGQPVLFERQVSSAERQSVEPWPQPKYPMIEGDIDYPWILQKEVIKRLGRGEDVILTGQQEEYALWWNKQCAAFTFDEDYDGPGVRVFVVENPEEIGSSQEWVVSKHRGKPAVGIPSTPLPVTISDQDARPVPDYLPGNEPPSERAQNKL